MSNQVWILVAVVVIIAIIVAYQRSRQSQVRHTRDLRRAPKRRAGRRPPGTRSANAKTTDSLACQQRIATGRKPACSGTGMADAPRGPMPPSSRPHVRPGALLRGTWNSAEGSCVAPGARLLGGTHVATVAHRPRNRLAGRLRCRLW